MFSAATMAHLAYCQAKCGPEDKEITHIPGCDPITGEPALLVVTTTCAADGATTTTQDVIPMTATITPGRSPESVYDKEDLTPLKIVGPAAAADVSTMFADALAASSVTAFSQEGSDIAEADVAECGTFNIAEVDGMKGIVINGDADNPVAAWSDPDGVNMANTFEVLDGCCALVTFCALKKFVPAKTA